MRMDIAGESAFRLITGAMDVCSGVAGVVGVKKPRWVAGAFGRMYHVRLEMLTPYGPCDHHEALRYTQTSVKCIVYVFHDMIRYSKCKGAPIYYRPFNGVN